jgi:hypothetical protein
VVDVESILERRRLERPRESTGDETLDTVVPADVAATGRRRRFRLLTRRRA